MHLNIIAAQFRYKFQKYKMGCCQSKLLNIQPIDQKYETNPIKQIDEFDLRKLACIAPANNMQIQLTEQNDSCSFLNLEIDLNNLINQYEKNQGKISYTCLVDPASKTIRSNQTKRVSLEPISESEMVSSSMMDTKLTSNSQKEPCKVARFLRDITVTEANHLQKQLFYGQYATINQVNLQKWSECQRVPIQYTHSQLLGVLGRKPRIQTAYILLSIYQFNLKYPLRLVYSSNSKEQGIRLFINGFKRLYPIQQRQDQKINSAQMMMKVCESLVSNGKNQTVDISHLFYHFTGWIPETIGQLHQNSQLGLILSRIKINTKKLNTVAFLVDYSATQVCVIEDIDPINSSFNVVSFTGQSNYSKQNIEWPIFTQKMYSLYLNWNPMIYQYVSSISLEYSLSNHGYPLVLITLPPAQQELQMRFLMQEHHETFALQTNTIFELYQYSGDRQRDLSEQALKVYQNKKGRLFSELLMFESCPVQNRYMILIKPQDDAERRRQDTKDITKQFTITFYSFQEIKVQRMNVYSELSHQVTETFTQKEIGFSINSPLFFMNPYFILEVPSCHLLKVYVKPLNTAKIDYQIQLLQNQQAQKRLTFMKPEDLIRQSQISCHFDHQGTLQCEPKVTTYTLMILIHQLECSCDFQIKVICLGLDKEELKLLKSFGNPIKIQRQLIQTEDNIILTHEFEWKKQAPGLRKRTKENSLKIFYDQNIFRDFFQNPYYDYDLDPGHYQFFVSSKTYQSQFTEFSKGLQQLGIEEREEYQSNAAQPPNVSIGVYEIKEQQGTNKKFKIQLDDEYYVPFGVGFWSPKTYLQGGRYRFVFSKIEQCPETGIFKIKKFPS